MKHESVMSACKELAQLRLARQRKSLSSCCLHIGQPAMLEFVRRHPGCTQKEMADEAGITPASVAASFKRLENAGFIMRRVDTADTRCNRVYITAAGEKELAACLSALRQIDEDMLHGIDEESLSLLESCLEKMIKNIS